jgi:ribosomal protein L37AE/L43A
MTEEERKHRQRMIDYADSCNLTYSCPVCGDDVSILFHHKIVHCPVCNCKLRIEPDAQFEGGMWHDLTRLVPIE